MSLDYARSLPTGQVGESDRSARPVRQTEGFASLPHRIAGDLRLLPIDLAILLAILFHARGKAVAWPSDTTIGCRVNRSRATVQRRLRHLEATGYIGRERCDDNPTGRRLQLLWRSALAAPTPPPTSETPPVSSEKAKPAPPVRHELNSETEKKKTPSAMGLESPPPAKQATERNATHAELTLEYESLGWLAKPLGDPLRAIAERSLQRILERPACEPGKPGAGDSTPRVESWKSGPQT